MREPPKLVHLSHHKSMLLFRIVVKNVIETTQLISSLTPQIIILQSKLFLESLLNTIRFLEQNGFPLTKVRLWGDPKYRVLLLFATDLLLLSIQFFIYVLLKTDSKYLIIFFLLFIFITFVASILFANYIFLKCFYTQFGGWL